MRTTTQTATLIEACKEAENPIILYTLVEKQTTNHIINECKIFNIPLLWFIRLFNSTV